MEGEGSSVCEVARSRIKSVTYTIVAVVSTYLILGSFDLMIKVPPVAVKGKEESIGQMQILEHVDGGAYLVTESGEATEFYRLSTDIISILFTLNSFLRFLFLFDAGFKAVSIENH